MDPFTWAAIASAGVGAIGKLMGGASNKAMDLLQGQAYDTKAGVDDLNAKIAGMGVDFAAAKETTDLGKIAEAGRQTLSAQRSYFAGGNLDPTFGSPLLVQAMTAGRIATDVGIAKTNFAIDKANSLTSEASFTAQGATDRLNAQLSRMKGDADETAGYFGAATSLLSGVGSLGKGGFNFGSSAGGTGGGMGIRLNSTGSLY